MFGKVAVYTVLRVSESDPASLEISTDTSMPNSV